MSGQSDPKIDAFIKGINTCNAETLPTLLGEIIQYCGENQHGDAQIGLLEHLLKLDYFLSTIQTATADLPTKPRQSDNTSFTKIVFQLAHFLKKRDQWIKSLDISAPEKRPNYLQSFIDIITQNTLADISQGLETTQPSAYPVLRAYTETMQQEACKLLSLIRVIADNIARLRLSKRLNMPESVNALGYHIAFTGYWPEFCSKNLSIRNPNVHLYESGFTEGAKPCGNPTRKHVLFLVSSEKIPTLEAVGGHPAKETTISSYPGLDIPPEHQKIYRLTGGRNCYLVACHLQDPSGFPALWQDTPHFFHDSTLAEIIELENKHLPNCMAKQHKAWQGKCFHNLDIKRHLDKSPSAAPLLGYLWSEIIQHYHRHETRYPQHKTVMTSYAAHYAHLQTFLDSDHPQKGVFAHALIRNFFDAANPSTLTKGYTPPIIIGFAAHSGILQCILSSQHPKSPLKARHVFFHKEALHQRELCLQHLLALYTKIDFTNLSRYAKKFADLIRGLNATNACQEAIQWANSFSSNQRDTQGSMAFYRTVSNMYEDGIECPLTCNDREAQKPTYIEPGTFE